MNHSFDASHAFRKRAQNPNGFKPNTSRVVKDEAAIFKLLGFPYLKPEERDFAIWKEIYANAGVLLDSLFWSYSELGLTIVNCDIRSRSIIHRQTLTQLYSPMKSYSIIPHRLLFLRVLDNLPIDRHTL